MTTLDDFNIIDIVVKNVNDFKAQNRPKKPQLSCLNFSQRFAFVKITIS